MREKDGLTLQISNLKRDISVDDLDHRSWQAVPETLIENYWSGKKAPPARHFNVRLLWSESALYVRFEANQNEPMVVNDRPDLEKKTLGLWDVDVCEIFIAPDKNAPNSYFEFEIAPSGEWVDLGISFESGIRKTDFEYASGMQSAVKTENRKVVMALKIPWSAFGNMPKAGSIWHGNLFRCVGKGRDRGYLAWQTTMTEKPDFHVPSRFGEFKFTL